MLLGELAYPALEGRESAVHLLPLGATEPHGPHAPLATNETSLVLADRLRLRDQARMDTLEANMVDMPEAIRWGKGERTFEILAEMLDELIREVAAA